MYLSRARLQQLPKSELHVHLRGAMPIDVFAELMRKYSREKIWRSLPTWRRKVFLQSPNIRRLLSLDTITIEDIRDFFDD
jgi:adenosine deaminase